MSPALSSSLAVAVSASGEEGGDDGEEGTTEAESSGPRMFIDWEVSWEEEVLEEEEEEEDPWEYIADIRPAPTTFFPPLSTRVLPLPPGLVVRHLQTTANGSTPTKHNNDTNVQRQG